MAQLRTRVMAVVSVAAFVLAACGKDREAAPTSTAAPITTDAPVTSGGSTDSTTAVTDTTAPAGPTFGDAAWPCGKGDGANTDDGSEVGVTADSVTIATGDDAGYAGSPGLSHEITDAMKALVAQCNELGGINGRQIKMNYYDAKLFEVPAAMQAACDAGTFFLVGEGWAFDSNQEEIRLGCNLPAVPTYTVSAAFAHGKDVYMGVPNPADETTSAFFAQMAKLFPEQVKHVATLTGAFSATQETRDRLVEVAPKFGWAFSESTLEHNPLGEADWTPFVKQIADSGAQMLSWQGTCLPHLLNVAQAAKANGLNLTIVADSNHYARECADANTTGALDNMHIRMAFIPFEEASANKATQDYLDLMQKYGGDVAMLGVQAASSFLLWATAASACGATLTRACVLQNLAGIHSWTGQGLHAETDPGSNHPPKCGLIMKLVGSTYSRVTPAEPGTYECDDAWISPITNTPGLLAAKLDANRISQQFAAG